MQTVGRAASIEVQATITRADGTVEHLGTISYWHRNPIKRWLFRLRRFMRI